MDYSSPENKDTFEISVKDGNRLGRRLGRGIANIAQAGKRGIIQEPFDPNAYDGDGDGIIQDGSQWARPAVLRSQSLPDLKPDTGTDTPEKERQEIRKDTTEQLRSSRRASGTSRRRKGSRALKSTTTADSTNFEWRQTATPRELAEAMIPDTVEKMLELNERQQVPRDAYATEEDYQFALDLHRKSLAFMTDPSRRRIEAVRQTYDDKYGPDSFDKDINNDQKLFDERMSELVGEPIPFYKQLGTMGMDDTEFKAQILFLSELFQAPNLPQFLKDTIAIAMIARQQQTTPQHGFFIGANEDETGFEKRFISPVEFIIARILAEEIDISTNENVPKNTNSLVFTQIIGQREISQPVTPRLVGGVDGYEVAEQLLIAYFGWRERNRSNFGINEPRAVTDEQIAARLQIAKSSGTRAALFGTIFAPHEQPLIRGDRSKVRNALIQETQTPSDDPRDYMLLRALLLRTLEDNPEFLAAVRKFGMPTVFVPHRAHAYTMDSPELTDNLLTKRQSEMTLDEVLAHAGVGVYYKSRYERAIQTDSFGFEEVSMLPEFDLMGSSRVLPPSPRLGGYYDFGTSQIVLTREGLFKDIFSKSEAEQGIVNITGTGSLSQLVGEAGILVHEFGHYIDMQLINIIYGAKYEQAKRKIAALTAKYSSDPDGFDATTTPLIIKEQIKEIIEELRDFMKGLPPRDNTKYQNDPLNNQRRVINKHGDVNEQIGYVTPERRVTGPAHYDFEKMSDDELSKLLNETVDVHAEIHGDTALLTRRRDGQDAPSAIATDSVSSPEPHVITSYGNTNTRERFAEILAAVLTRVGQKYPTTTNNAAVNLVARLFGLDVEPQDVTSLSRRTKRRGRFTDEVEDISGRIISDIKVVSPETKRTSDGHRPGMASRTEADDLRFDPDERSRMQSRSNIGIETDERLYAFSDKPMVKDRGTFGTSPRTYSIGDHHFYDYDAPFTERGQRFIGAASAQRFINRDRPHHGDMMRAISATQLGFFVDDMPTYPTTTAGQKRVLRALVTGKIAKETTSDERRIIEEAMKDTTRLLQEVQATPPTERDIYRALSVDVSEFLDSISVGDIFPMPLTSFGDKAPSKNVGAVLRIESGAKARKVNLSDGVPNYITAGNFEVVSVERDGERTIATLRHIETFDPRHSAMRPVDEKRNTPMNMRFLGSNQPRYNAEQAQRMIVDRERRLDRAKAIGLRSTTSGDTELDAEIRDYEKTKNQTDEKLSKIVELTSGKIKEFTTSSVAKRLAVAIQAVRDKHGDRTPWVDDARYIRDYISIDLEANQRLGNLLIETITDAVNNGTAPRGTFPDVDTNMGLANVDLSSAQIRHFLTTGELVFPGRIDEINDAFSVEEATITVPMSLFETDEKWIEAKQLLEINARALEAVERAFLLDGSDFENGGNPIGSRVRDGSSALNGVIDIDDKKLEVRPVGKGVYVALRGEDRVRTKYKQTQRLPSIFVDATVANSGTEHDKGVGFQRVLTVTSDGKLLVNHDRMWLKGRGDSLPNGAATVLNQHAALWWRQHDKAQINISSPVSDGIIVWPRLGFTKRKANNEEILGRPDSFPVVLAELTRQVRKALSGTGDIKEQREIPRDPNLPTPPSRPDLLGGPPIPPAPRYEDVFVEEKGVSFGITPENRKLIVGWLALAEKKQRDGDVPENDSSLATLLANLIDINTMSKDAATRWKNIFSNAGMGDSGLIMEFDRNGGTDTDKDWLPEFLIPDPAKVNAERVESSNERSGLLSRTYRSDDGEGVKRDLFIGDADEPMTMEQAGRISGALRSRQSLGTLREESGFNVPPVLFTRAELQERQAEFGAPLYGIGRIDTADGSNQLQRFMFGTNDSSDLVVFTEEPFRHINRMYLDGLPNSDPATTRNGAVGYLAPWAQVVRGSELRGAINQIIKPKDRRRFLAEQDYDGLMNELLTLGHYRLYDTPEGERIGLASSSAKPSANTKIKNRLLKAVADLDNHHRRQTETEKYKKVRDKLLENIFSSEQDVSEVLATILGYDAIREADEVKIVNNGAVSILDEIISFAEAAKDNDFQRYRVPPQNVDKRFTGDSTWFDNPAEARLFTRDEPISIRSNGVITQDYIRSVRQDFNVDLSERRGGLASRRDREDPFRGVRRMSKPEVWVALSDDEFKEKIANIKERFAIIQAKFDAWDKANDDLDRPDWFAREEIKKELIPLTDEVAYLIKTSNNVVEIAIEHEAAIDALTEFLRERNGENALQDIPEENLRKIAELLQLLIQEKNDSPQLLNIDSVRKRHGYLKRLMRDFDIQYEVEKSGREYGDEDDIELDDVDVDMDVDERAESLVEHLFRGLFDEKYEEWIESQRFTPFDFDNPAFEALRRLIPQQPDPADKVMGTRFRQLFDGITTEQRREWHATSGQLLDDEYNYSYQEEIADEYEDMPSGGSAKPSDIPAPTWRKIRSAMSRARGTKFDGERDAAESAALRLIEKTRPDLATREFISGIRSSTSQGVVMSRASTATPKPMRGGSPDSPAVPIEEHNLSVVASKLREMGYDIDEVDLLPNGKVGHILSRIVRPNPLSRQLVLDDFIKKTEDGTIAPGNLLGLDPNLLRDVVAVTIEQARKSGLEVIKIEGHKTKKVLGPVDTEIADLLGDEMDIAMLRTQGAPTYENLIDIAAAYYAEVNRLNKAFGQEEGKPQRAFKDTLDSEPDVEGSYLVYRDARGNEVVRLLQGENRKTQILVGKPTLSRIIREMSLGLGNHPTNDVIFSAMAEAVGFVYGGDLVGTKNAMEELRESLQSYKERLTRFEIAPTTAGNHIKMLLENTITEKQMTIDLFERMGKRYVHLMRERGLSEDDIKKLMSKVLTSSNVYQAGEPIGAEAGGTIVSQALSAFLRKNLSSPLLPYFTEATIREAGLHEIGHFGLGQGFTRHGEFVANAWPFFVHGPAFWRTFLSVQTRQSDTFDQWTIKEHFGRTLTPEQQRIVKENIGAMGSLGGARRTINVRHSGLSFDDRDRVKSDVVSAIRARTDLTDVEKQEVIDNIETLYTDGGFFIPKRQFDPEGFQTEIGLEENGLDENGESVTTSKLLDEMIPLPAHLFGWQRSKSPRPDGMASKTTLKFTKVKGGRPTLPGRDLGKLRRVSDYETTYPDATKDKNRLRKQALKYFGSLSPRELDAVTEYIESSSTLNYFLRYGEMPRRGPGMPTISEQEIVRRAEELTDILENSPPLTQPVILYRGLSDIEIEDYDHLLSLGVGGEFSDDGIISTSTSPSIATNFQGRGSKDSYGIPLLEIIVPKGGRALSLVTRKDDSIQDDPLFEEEYNPVIGELFGNVVVGSYEEEVLLPPGTKFRIVAIIPSKDIYKHDGAFAPYGADTGDSKPKIIVEVIP